LAGVVSPSECPGTVRWGLEMVPKGLPPGKNLFGWIGPPSLLPGEGFLPVNQTPAKKDLRQNWFEGTHWEPPQTPAGDTITFRDCPNGGRCYTLLPGRQADRGTTCFSRLSRASGVCPRPGSKGPRSAAPLINNTHPAVVLGGRAPVRSRGARSGRICWKRPKGRFRGCLRAGPAPATGRVPLHDALERSHVPKQERIRSHGENIRRLGIDCRSGTSLP